MPEGEEMGAGEPKLAENVGTQVLHRAAQWKVPTSKRYTEDQKKHTRTKRVNSERFASEELAHTTAYTWRVGVELGNIVDELGRLPWEAHHLEQRVRRRRPLFLGASAHSRIHKVIST